MFLNVYMLAYLLKFTSTVFAQEDVINEQTYIPIFRSGHNLSILYSFEYSTWSLNQTSSASSQDTISPLVNSGINSLFLLRYAYHINIVSNFGFFVGTTAGFIIDMGNYGNLRQGYGFSFPTMLGGLSLNLGQNFRLLSGAEYGANWYPAMSITTDARVPNTIAPVPDMFAVFGGMDYFFQKDKAFSFQLGWRHQNITPLNNNASGTYLNTLKIYSDSYFAQLGLTLQIGDINQAITSVLPVQNY
ncbi:hypothetical protein AXG55_11080 [Silvanigrella aquatica]|uniref:Outer membrane protein beta-barrel domain-containing protein n=2 Tax=Silvanigrella aquatica TaxID=1915309 RepID=A0A1L4D2J2_9BACT|nr:hypothetical protein AXG55_11080 [Silvanigrella aquatica]